MADVEAESLQKSEGKDTNEGEKKESKCCGMTTSIFVLFIVGLVILLVNMVLSAVLLNKYDDWEFEYDPEEPPIVGVMPGKSDPKIVLAMDVDYPPYA